MDKKSANINLLGTQIKMVTTSNGEKKRDRDRDRDICYLSENFM